MSILGIVGWAGCSACLGTRTPDGTGKETTDHHEGTSLNLPYRRMYLWLDVDTPFPDHNRKSCWH
jgi:hypothetical protein